MQQRSVNGVHSMSRHVGRLEGFGGEGEAGWWLPEFVGILNTELEVSWCLLETAGNQRADREPWKGQRTSSIENELSERDSSERHKGNWERRLIACHEYMRGGFSGVLMKRKRKSARTWMGGGGGGGTMSGGYKTEIKWGKDSPGHLLHIRDIRLISRVMGWLSVTICLMSSQQTHSLRLHISVNWPRPNIAEIVQKHIH